MNPTPPGVTFTLEQWRALVSDTTVLFDDDQVTAWIHAHIDTRGDLRISLLMLAELCGDLVRTRYPSFEMAIPAPGTQVLPVTQLLATATNRDFDTLNALVQVLATADDLEPALFSFRTLIGTYRDLLLRPELPGTEPPTEGRS